MIARDEAGCTIDQVEDAIQAAMLASDVAALDALVADELVFIGPDGSAIAKASDLAAHRTGATRFARIEETVRIVDEAGKTTDVTASATVWIGDEWRDVTLRWIRQWRIIDGRWQVIRGSVSALSPTG